jgi:putative ABC transport system substrate-binding protein
MAWPIAARAQQALPVIGYLGGANESMGYGVALAAYRRALAEAGFVEGKTLQIEWRWEDGDNDKALPFLNDLIERHCSVLTLTGGWNGGQPVGTGPIYQALFGSGIPAVASFGRDPRIGGVIANLNRPERNLTGDNLQTQELEAKRLNLLHEAIPTAKTFAYLARPADAITATLIQDTQKAAGIVGVRLVVLSANTVAEIDSAFATLKAMPVDALIISANPFFGTQNRDLLTGLVTEARIPAIAEFKEFATGGALFAYGASIDATHYQIGAYTAAILKGAKIADLPVVQNQTYDFVINMKTAKSLGITIPPLVFAQASEVIE